MTNQVESRIQKAEGAHPHHEHSNHIHTNAAGVLSGGLPPISSASCSPPQEQRSRTTALSSRWPPRASTTTPKATIRRRCRAAGWKSPLTAFHLEKPAAVRLEWAFFGDNLDSDKVVKHGSGTENVELAQSKKADVKTKSVTFTFTPRHSVRTGSGKRARVKVIEATGVRYHAWGVRAFVDGKLAGEAYSSPSIQKLMGGTD